MLRPTTIRPVLRAGRRCACRAVEAPSTPRRSLFAGRRASRGPQDLDINRLDARRRDYESHRAAFLAAGAVAGIVSLVYTAWRLKQAISLEREKQRIATRCDAPGGGGSSIPSTTFKTEAGEQRKIVVHDEHGNVVVPTGNSVVPAFPREMSVRLPTSSSSSSSSSSLSSPITAAMSDPQGCEFTLVGLGMRTVTFIGIQVYLVGFYVATQDIARLQKFLVRRVNEGATTLIPSEKEALRRALLDPAEGEAAWESILREAGCRSLFRITPVRDTDFHHLRDGFVRAIAARPRGCDDDDFRAAMRDFKTIFARGQVPKKREMLLCRDELGALSVMYDDGKGRQLLGTIADERVARLLWLNYLAGKKVASEPARQNIIQGVMEFVERPVGTVATQVI